jgi:dUTP pyrophosphatase
VAAIPDQRPAGSLIGKKVSQSAGKTPSTGKKLDHFGTTSSWWSGSMRCSFIPLDYALFVSKKLPVLLVAEPGLEPTYAQPGDAGADLRAAIDAVIPAMGRFTVRTGVSIALPDGYVGLVHPRSGLSAKHGITVLNAPGTVDAGYRGEIAVTLYNSTPEEFTVSKGDRIAQLVIQAIEIADFISVDTLPGSHRGTSGFGSTGTK